MIKFLCKLGITEEFYDEIITSGDAAQFSLMSGDFGHNIYHIGPQRDFCFFERKHQPPCIELVPIADASSIVCTGLFNDQVEQPSDYADIINEGVQNNLPLLCANPDIQVDYGNQRLWCAGAITIKLCFLPASRTAFHISSAYNVAFLKYISYPASPEKPDCEITQLLPPTLTSAKP